MVLEREFIWTCQESRRKLCGNTDQHERKDREEGEHCGHKVKPAQVIPTPTQHWLGSLFSSV